MNRPRSHPAPRLTALLILTLLILGAGPPRTIRVDDWQADPPGNLDLSAAWSVYPPSAGRVPFKHAPAIIIDDGRHALELMTEGEPMRIGRELKINLKATPWLVWQWKPLVLPDRGDVRDHRRNDQAGRVMLAFEGMKGLLYVWDTLAPAGTEVGPDELEFFQRVLIVVRSGSQGVGRWHEERRDVERDYRRAFGESPRAIKWVGLESHSDDTASRSAVRFGNVQFEGR